jgi:fibronectin type 3 domain-containing protein
MFRKPALRWFIRFLAAVIVLSGLPIHTDGIRSAPTVKASGSLNVPITVKEGAGVASSGFPVSVVVPLPFGEYYVTDSFRLTDESGNTVPAQFEVLNRHWSKDNSIRHVQVHFQPSVAANGSAQFYLRDDGTGSTGGSLTLTETETAITVNTGAVQFTVSKTNFNLFNSVTYGGDQIISPSNVNGGVFTDRFGNVQYAAQMDAPNVTIEEDGPMRAVIRAELPAKFRLTNPNLEPGVHDLTEPLDEGDYTHDHGYIVRIYAYSDQSYIQVDYSLANSDMSVLAAYPLYFEDFSLSFQLPSGWNDVKIGGESAHVETTVGTGKYIYAYDDTSVANEPAYVVKSGPGNNLNSDTTIAGGYRAPGWIDLSGSNKGMMVKTKRFWQTWPSGLEVDSDRKVHARLFPKWGHGMYWTVENGQYVYNNPSVHLHWLEDMQVVTNSLLYYFHDKDSSAELNNLSALFERPPVGVIPVEWYRETGVTTDKGGAVPENVNKTAPFDEAPVLNMTHQYYDLGYMNFDGNGYRKRTGNAGNVAPSRHDFIATGNPNFYYSSEDGIVYGTLNTRPTWLLNYTYEDGAIYSPTANMNLHPVNAAPEGARSWRIWYPASNSQDINQKALAPHIAGTNFIGWYAWDYQHLWTYEVEDFYNYSGNKLIYDWYKGIAEMMRTDIHGTEHNLYEFADIADTYSTRGKAHLLNTLLQAYRVVGDPTYLETAHHMVKTLAQRQFKYGGFDNETENAFMLGYMASAIINFLELVKGYDHQAYVDGFGVLHGIMEFNQTYNHYGYYINPNTNGDEAYLYPGRANGTSATIMDPEAWWWWHTGDKRVYESLRAYIAGELGSMPVDFDPVWRGHTVGRLVHDLFERYDQAKPETEPPAAVTNLTATVLGGGQVKLDWTGPSDAVEYHVRWATRPISWQQTQDEGRINWWKAAGVGNSLTGGGAKSLTISDLPNDSVLYFAVISFDEHGNMSEMSNVATAVTGTGDVTNPGAITNLTATALSGESVELVWTSKGDDGDSGTAALTYDIRYATVPITDANWNSATPIDDEPAPRNAGRTQRMTVVGLPANTTLYFAMKAIDDVGNTSLLSNVAQATTGAADTTPPSRIAMSNETARQTSVVLNWLAPGNDGDSGTAHRYDLRYSTSPLTEANWNSAVQVDGVPKPMTAGTLQSMEVAGLEPGTMYYFGIKAYDQANQASELSNIVQVATRPENKALYKPVTQNGQMDSLHEYQPTFILTDGYYWREGASADYYIRLKSGRVWMQVDLGEQLPVKAISLQHIASSTYQFKDVIIQLSNDPSFTTGVTTVYNNDANGDAGQGVGTDPEYVEGRNGKNFVLSSPVSARYVRVWSRGSSGSSLNMYTELQVYLEAPLAESPDKPTGLGASPGSGQVSLSWPAVTGADIYNVYRRVSPSGSWTAIALGVPATAYLDTGVTNGTAYDYRIQAVNAGGVSFYSDHVTATPVNTGIPSVPTGLAAAAGDGEVDLSWSASAGATSYNVKRSTSDGGPYTTIAPGVTATAFTDTNVTNGTTYYYVVSAVNANGESANSAQVSAKPGAAAAPDAPTGLTASAGDGEVDLSWSASAGATSYNVKRSTSDGGPYTTIAPGVTATAFTDTNVTNGTTYYYVVSAVNASGESADSAQASATPAASGGDIPLDRSGWTATASNSANVNWALDGNLGTRWTGGTQTIGHYYQVNMGEPHTFNKIVLDSGSAWPNDYPEGYEVFVSNDGSNWTSVTTGAGSGRVTTITFPVQTAQYFKIVLTANDGSWWSIVELNVYPAQDPAPAVPTGLTANAGDGEVDLSWSASAGATSYNVKRSTTDGGPYTTIAPGVTATAFTDTNVTNGTTYYYVVSAVNASGESDDSAQASATPAASGGDIPLDRSGWTLSASNPSNTSRAVDGNLGTRWTTSAAQSAGKYFQINLGSQETFYKIELDSGPSWPNDYPEGYEVFVSNDGSNWTSVTTGSGSGRVTTITFPEQTAQYIRIELTTSDGSWWSIAEIQVYQ